MLSLDIPWCSLNYKVLFSIQGELFFFPLSLFFFRTPILASLFLHIIPTLLQMDPFQHQNWAFLQNKPHKSADRSRRILSHTFNVTFPLKHISRTLVQLYLCNIMMGPTQAQLAMHFVSQSIFCFLASLAPSTCHTLHISAVLYWIALHLFQTISQIFSESLWISSMSLNTLTGPPSLHVTSRFHKHTLSCIM